MPTPPRRRWFQFGMSSLLWLTLIVGLIVGGAVRERQVRERHREKAAEWAEERADLRAEVARLKDTNTMLEHLSKMNETDRRPKVGR